ncbi:unnamed protein product [Ambrosiozyma monospora]|uniref:Unnamed protein product n=1 Tax=Ambrosiozyma monospora TaxID=43982 RepID=A0ACB5SWM9_AMBMO|nr:unnamed protein product [Ambrosiozyma monospora]
MTKPVIAVFGTNGALGKPTIEALTSPTFSSKISFPIRAITRDPTKYTSTEKVKYYKADAKDVDSFKDALTGVDVFINLGGISHGYYDAPLDALLRFAKSTIKLYIPSEFGVELDATDLPGFFGYKVKHSERARASGVKTIDVCTALFFGPGSYLYEQVCGLDPVTNVALVGGDGNIKFDVCYLGDIGKALAAIVTYCDGDYSQLPDKIRISSDRITNEEALDHYEKIHPGVKITRKYLSQKEIYKKTHEMYNAGFDMNDFLSYLHYMMSQGEGKGLAFTKNENELINPGQSLFKWIKFGSI